MTAIEISREDLMTELEKELESGTSLIKKVYKARVSNPMDKREFSFIRKELNITQAQLAEILDMSIKTVQAYEQGRSEIPGLVTKVLRLLKDNSVFNCLFKGEMTKIEYSKYVEMKSVIANSDSMMELTNSVVTAVSKFSEKKTTNEIESMTGIENFVVINNK